MNVNREYRSPNYNPEQIEVEFVVLHHTAGDLKTTLAWFEDPESQVSAHLVIDAEGDTYEIVPCWDGTTQRAWHAGQSSWTDADDHWQKFNDFSIGIELVNLNGNTHPYTDQQYDALVAVIGHLRSLYPALDSPARIVGHQHIAGNRGKTDPGKLFDWERLFSECYPGQDAPSR